MKMEDGRRREQRLLPKTKTFDPNGKTLIRNQIDALNTNPIFDILGAVVQ